MLITALAAVLAAPVPPPPPTPAPSACVVAVDHGKLNWFEGSYEEALAKAAASKQLVFIDFWTSW
jgi:hypothetical protein